MARDNPFDERHQRARALTREAKKNLLAAYWSDPNIIAVGFGRRIVSDEITDEPAMVVYVGKKLPFDIVPPSRLLPRRVYLGRDWVEVDVVETGPIYPLSFTARMRPAPAGISVAHTAVTAGTLGAWVIDNTDRTDCLLSNNHVIANQNAAAIGDAIVQPGPFDGGATPADDLATLKRFATIAPTGNTVDCAIGEVINPADVDDRVINDIIPTASGDHPAVGLLFAGSCNRTIMNPIDDVLAALDISFPNANATVFPEIGTDVEKVGRTTEYTTSTVTEIDLTVTIQYDFGPATFDMQIATMWMSAGGDSGSVVYRGGAGGAVDNCGCASTSAASQILGRDLRLDQAVEHEFRSKYLRHTAVGRELLDIFFTNEPYLVGRIRKAAVSEDDRRFAQYLYEKNVDEARLALLRPMDTDLRLNRDHLDDLEQALGRARQYMTDAESEAADELLKMAYDAEGKSPRDIMAMLDDPALADRVRELAQRIDGLELPERRPERPSPKKPERPQPPEGKRPQPRRRSTRGQSRS